MGEITSDQDSPIGLEDDSLYNSIRTSARVEAHIYGTRIIERVHI